MNRLFIALALAPETRRFVADTARRLSHDLNETCENGGLASVSGLRWVSAENYHVTIKFLGDVDEDRIPEIDDALSTVTRAFPALRVLIGGVGTFPPIRADRESPAAGHTRPPRTLWVGFPKGGQSVSALAAAIDERLAALGWPPERKALHPHITIARVREGPRRGRRDGDRSGHRRDRQGPVDWRVCAARPPRAATGEDAAETPAHEAIAEMFTHVALMRSELKPSGAEYHVVSHHDLSGDASEHGKTV